MGTKILTSLHQNTTTHIYDHIHEWMKQIKLVKSPIHDWLLVDCLTIYLIPPITKYIAMNEVIFEECAIYHNQHLHFIYSQSSTLYGIIPHAP